MADANTTLYDMVKPEVGASPDTWGNKLNTDFDDIDAMLGSFTLTGSSNAYVLTTGLSLDAYASGQRFAVKWNHTNSGSATLNVDGLGAKTIKKRDASTNCSASDLVSGTYAIVSYDGTNFVLLSVVASDFQPLDATLTALAALSYTSGTLIITETASDVFALASDALYAHLAGTEIFSGARTFTAASTFKAAVTHNLNAASLPSPPTGTVLQLGNADSVTSVVVLDAFGTVGSAVQARQASNTAASPSATVSGRNMFQFSAIGYGATAYSTARWAVRCTAIETWTDTAQGAYGSLFSTPIGTATVGEKYRWGDLSSTLELGYRDGGPGSVPDTSYTFALTDRGTCTDHSSGSTHSYTVPPASSVAWPANSILMGYNSGAGTLTIARGSGVVLRNSAGTDADLSVPQYSYYMLRRVASDVWAGRVY